MNKLVEPRYFTPRTSLIGVFYFLFLVLNSPLTFSIQPIEFEFQTTRDTKRTYDGITGLNFERIETQFLSPIFKRDNTIGKWLAGLDISENRMFFSGIQSGTRRLYRFAVPIQYFPKRKGRIQHEWMLTPAYYSDESFIDQKRITLEYAWQFRYLKNRKMNLVAGFRSDSRSGENGIYPIFGLEAQPNKNVFHHWVFPNIYSEIKFNKKLTSRVFAKINGGNWDYLISTGGGISNLSVSDWKIGLGARLRTKMPFDYFFETGLRIMGSASFNDTKGSTGDSYFITMGIKTRFQ
ncbi:MAG: hypothetical protein ACJAYK_002002 [Crocinitomicaceae bacterium]|jgi:hypothetical protein